MKSSKRSKYSQSLSPIRRPDACGIALKYVGNGSEFDGLGNMAIDKDGNIWITNNYDGQPLA
jgi:hypothetical protein